MDLERRILQFIGKNKLITPRGLLLVGVSGGADSMALLTGLASLRHELGVRLCAVHFNHKARSQAGHDELFVARYCRRLNIPLVVGRRSGGKVIHLSEDEARRMRFAFFIKTAKRLKAQAVALAHTRNDLAETVLMRLMRGSGLYGLRAILPFRTMEGVSFVRPLMGVTREDVEDYLKARKTAYCTDATNRLKKYERNKVRLDLLPLLIKEYNPKVIDALSDLAQTAGEDYAYLAAEARKQFKKIVTISGKKVKMDLKRSQKQHPAILRLILRQMVEDLTGDAGALTFEHIHALEDLAAAGGHGAVDLPHHLKAVKTQRSLELFYA